MGEELSEEDLHRLGLEVDLEKIDSAVLRRLIEEVRQEDAQQVQRVYNRTHNRHNRGM